MIKTGYLLSNGTDLGDTYVNGETFGTKIITNGGIVGPSTQITYANNMVGYTKSVPMVDSSITISTPSSGSSSDYKSISSGFTFPSPGVYIVSLYAVLTAVTGGTVGIVNYLNLALSTTTDGAATTASFKNTTNNTHNIAINTTGIITGAGNIHVVIPNTSTTYYFTIQCRFSNATVTITPSTSGSYCYFTRIA